MITIWYGFCSQRRKYHIIFSLFVHVLCVVQRYYYYIEKGIASCEVSTLLKTDVEKIYALIPQSLLQAAGLQASVKRLLQEARDDFEFSMKKSIGEEPCMHFQWDFV